MRVVERWTGASTTELKAQNGGITDGKMKVALLSKAAGGIDASEGHGAESFPSQADASG